MPPKRATKRKPTKGPQGLSIVLYGPSGSGKTSFASQFPRCGFIIDGQERGIKFLSQRSLVPDPVWIEVIDVDIYKFTPLVERVAESATDDNIDTLVIESFTGLETICFAEACEQGYDGNWEEFYNYSRGPKQSAKRDFPKLFNACNLVMDQGKNVLITGHTKTKEVQTPEGTKVLQYVAYGEVDAWTALHRWASAVFFLNTEAEEDKRKRGVKTTARPDLKRIMYLEATPYHVAKNWYGLQGIVDLGDTPAEGYQNFLKVLG